MRHLHDEYDGYDLRADHSLSFHVPRRPVGSLPGTPPATSSGVMTLPPVRPETSPRTASPPPPRVPPKSRVRSYTAPETVDHLKERIAEALLEKERLQDMIDDVIERQSVYLGSRPSTSHSMAAHMQTCTSPCLIV